MAPSEDAKESPDRAGEIDQVVTVPLEVVGVDVVIAVPLVRVNEFGLWVIEVGATSLTLQL